MRIFYDKMGGQDESYIIRMYINHELCGTCEDNLSRNQKKERKRQLNFSSYK